MVEQYDYDQPLGIYLHEGRERLASAIIRDVHQYEQVTAAIKATGWFHGGHSVQVELTDLRPQRIEAMRRLEQRVLLGQH